MFLLVSTLDLEGILNVLGRYRDLDLGWFVISHPVLVARHVQLEFQLVVEVANARIQTMLHTSSGLDNAKDFLAKYLLRELAFGVDSCSTQGLFICFVWSIVVVIHRIGMPHNRGSLREQLESWWLCLSRPTILIFAQLYSW
jgi:hypothetical protein